jgi:hypothetical protein
MIPFSWPHRRAVGTAGRRALISHDPRGRERSAASQSLERLTANTEVLKRYLGVKSIGCCSVTSPGALTREERTRPSRHS